MEVSTSEKVKGENEKYCSDCGDIINAKAEICPKCGVRQMEPPAAQSSSVNLATKDKTIAIILTLLLGWLGIHKFYLGENILGVFYLIFCWTLIPALISIFDLIHLLMMKDGEFDEKYNS